MKGIIYDCEIIRCIPGKDSNPITNTVKDGTISREWVLA